MTYFDAGAGALSKVSSINFSRFQTQYHRLLEVFDSNHLNILEYKW